jgi:DNA-binding NtrC family response regulator
VASRLFGYKKGAFTGATTDMRGVFDEAHRGTLFLDEVGDLHPACQVMLLRALQENAILPVGATQTSPVDVRVIAATNRDLGECISEGTFREDLFFRLYVYLVRVPPLRERKEDISLLVEHFADAACRECGRPGVSFSDEAMRKLYLHDWPGNVRELQNCVKRAILSAGGTTVDAKDITFAELPREQAIGSREDREKDTLLEALKSSRTVKEAYEKLKMPKATFYEKLKKHGLESRALLEP